MVMAMVVQALKGSIEEVNAAPTLQEKARRARLLTGTLLRELFGIASSLPYAYHATALWRHPERQQRRWRFNLLRNVRYGPAHRNFLDVYTPTSREHECALPVLIFIHGGVWASGDKALFSPIGATLAHNSAVAILVQYSLYPQLWIPSALHCSCQMCSCGRAHSAVTIQRTWAECFQVSAKEQVKEISLALTWVMDNVSHYGGDPERIHVLGHSAGGHLCGMLHWERARRNLRFKRASFEAEEDKRYPRGFMGLSGVYSINEHYEYERKRGVEAISCMKLAMDGPSGFSAMSPEFLFSSLLRLKRNADQIQFADEQEALSHDLSSLDMRSSADWNRWAEGVPPFVFFTSEKDNVVPPLTSTRYHKVLRELGCRSSLSTHRNLGHDDLACWVKGMGGADNPLPKDLIDDVIAIVTDAEKINTFVSCHCGPDAAFRPSH